MNEWRSHVRVTLSFPQGVSLLGAEEVSSLGKEDIPESWPGLGASYMQWMLLLETHPPEHKQLESHLHLAASQPGLGQRDHHWDGRSHEVVSTLLQPKSGRLTFSLSPPLADAQL